MVYGRLIMEKLAFDVKRGDFTADRVSVDGTTVRSAVVAAYFTDE